MNYVSIWFPTLDRGDGGEEPAVWRLHPLPSEVPQVNLDIFSHSECNTCVFIAEFTHIHTHSTYTAVLSPTLLMDRMESVRNMEEEEEVKKEWGICGHLKDSLFNTKVVWSSTESCTTVSHSTALYSSFSMLSFFFFVYKITISPELKLTSVR